MNTILLLAYAVSPTKGSEYAVAWNYIKEMSCTNKIVVFYGKSDRDMGNVREMTEYLQNNEVPNVTFFQIKASSRWGKEGIIHSNFIKTAFYDYQAYKDWHYQAYLAALDLIKKQPVDVVHFLCPIGFKEPGYLWKLPKPYIWGPVAGAHPRPLPLWTTLSFKEKLAALGRNVIHPFMFRYSFRVSDAIKNADVVIAATPLTQKQLMSYYAKEADYLPENGILHIERTDPVSREPGTILKLIWIGTLCPRKGLSVLLDALSLLGAQVLWELHVIGEGDLFQELYDQATRLQLNNKIIWHHSISRQEVQNQLNKCHLHCITSLGEATTTVLFEAMAKGIPTMTLDHCGMSGVVNNENGIKIPIHTYRQITQDLADNITDLYTHPQKITQLSLGTLKSANEYLWSNRASFFNQKIKEAIRSFQK